MSSILLMVFNEMKNNLIYRIRVLSNRKNKRILRAFSFTLRYKFLLWKCRKKSFYSLTNALLFIRIIFLLNSLSCSAVFTAKLQFLYTKKFYVFYFLRSSLEITFLGITLFTLNEINFCTFKNHTKIFFT